MLLLAGICLILNKLLLLTVSDSTLLQTDDGEILVDFSKNLINEEVLAMLLALVTLSLSLSLSHTHTHTHTRRPGRGCLPKQPKASELSVQMLIIETSQAAGPWRPWQVLAS